MNPNSENEAKPQAAPVKPVAEKVDGKSEPASKSATTPQPVEPAPKDPFAQLVQIKADYVDGALAWYEKNARLPRYAFRAAGAGAIVLSLSIPFLAAGDETMKSWGVPAAALAIAILTAFNNFFAWQKTWEKRITTQLMIEASVALWKTEMDAARRQSVETDAYEAALQATQTLIERTRALTVSETGNGFSSFIFPEELLRNKTGAGKVGG